MNDLRKLAEAALHCDSYNFGIRAEDIAFLVAANPRAILALLDDFAAKDARLEAIAEEMEYMANKEQSDGGYEEARTWEHAERMVRSVLKDNQP